MASQRSYIQRRKDTLYFRLSVPKHLRGVLGVREITRSLETQDVSVAVPAALELAASAKRLFIDLRGAVAVDFEKLRARLAKQIAELRLSEQREDYEERIEQLQREIRVLQARVEQSSDAANEEVRSRIRALRPELLARIQAAKVDGVAEGMRNAARVLSTSDHPRRDPADFTGHLVEDQKAIQARRTIIDALDQWRRLKSPAPATVEIYTAEARRFQDYYPELAVSEIRKQHIGDYVEHLQVKKGLSARSISKAHGAIRALLNVCKDRGWIVGDNPAERSILPKVGKSGRRGYSSEELQVILNSAVFARGERPRAGKGEAAFWLPLLLLWTGARREEIAQLTVDDVFKIEGVDVISIDPDAADGRVKTEQSRRIVPVHGELIGLGFLDYVNRLRRQHEKRIFPKLKKNKRGALGAKWGDWWGRYVKNEVKITDEAIAPAHSFRHAFITETRRINMPEYVQRALVGHTDEGSAPDVHDAYGTVAVGTLNDWINKVTFGGLDISKVKAPKT